MSQKKNNNIIIALSIVAAILVTCSIVFIVLNIPSKEEKSVTMEDQMQQTARWQEESKAESIRLDAKAYQKTHGYYPQELSDFWQNPDSLPELKYKKTSSGFEVTYRSANGQIVLLQND